LVNRLDIEVANAFKRYPNSQFVLTAKLNLTFKDLDTIIDSIIEILNSNLKGQREVNLMAILCDNKFSSLTAILAALRLKIPYIPLDDLAPFRRNINIIIDNKVPALVLSKSIFEGLSRDDRDLLSDFLKIEISEINCYCFFANKSNNTPISTNLAYILFTSGSTGKPKGIEITHNNALSFVNWAIDLIDNQEGLVFGSIAPFQFDLSVFDIYVSILSGGQLVLFENDEIRNPRLITQLIDDFQINILYTTPTVYRLLWTFGKILKRSLTSLKVLIFAGEIMPFELLNLMKQKCPLAKFYNFYGPTETNVCTYFNATNSLPDGRPNVPIGQCTPYSNFKITEEPNNEEGELLISGESVFNGYFGNSDLTDSKFLLINKESWYLTGDIVKLDTNGDLVYLGRSDRMVKIKGYRIELNEIENVILRHQNILNVAVVINTRNEEKIIISYIELDNKAVTFNLDVLKEYCSEYLPFYMIPNSIVLLDELPINSNSKVDYNKLSQ